MKRQFEHDGKNVEYYCIAFTFNTSTHEFDKKAGINGFRKIPPQIQLEEEKDSFALKSTLLSSSGVFSLLLEKSTAAHELLYRCQLSDKEQSEVLVKFFDDFRRMYLYVFNGINVQETERLKFQLSFVAHLMFEVKEWEW